MSEKYRRLLKIDIIFLLLFLFSLGYLSIFYNYGINLYDEGIPLNLAMRVLHGEIPGQDFLSTSPVGPPGYGYLCAILFELFGINLGVFRLAVLFMTAFMPGLIYLIARRIMPNTFAFLAAILMLSAPAVYYTRFFIFFTLLNTLTITKYLEKRNRFSLLVAGLVAGISSYFRWDLGIIAVIAVYWAIIAGNIYYDKDKYELIPKKILKMTKEVSLYTLIVVIILIPLFIFSLLPNFKNGLISSSYFSLSNIYQWAVPFPKISFSLIFEGWKSLESLRLLFENSLYYLPVILYFVTLFLIGHRFFLRKLKPIDLYLALFLIFGVLIFYRVIKRPDFSHLLQSLPITYILGCYLLSQLYQKGRILMRQKEMKDAPFLIAHTSLSIAILIIPMIFIVNIVFHHGFWSGSIGVLRGEHTLLDTERAEVYCLPHRTKMISHIVDYIKEHTRPEENIFVLPFNSLWYFLCERNNPTPYDILTPEVVVNENIQRRVINDLYQDQTKYIIYHDWAKDKREDRRFRYYAQLIEAYIRSNYHFEKKIDDFDILRRNETTNLYPFITAKSRDSFDFIVNLPNAEVKTINPNEVRVARFYIQGEGRYVLFEHPPGEITYKLKIPKKASLVFGMGIDPAVWTKEGDGVLFEVLLIDDRPQRHKLFSKYIDPKNREADRKWHDEENDLSEYGGQEVSLSFLTSPGSANDRGYDWAGWSEPRIVWEKTP